MFTFWKFVVKFLKFYLRIESELVKSVRLGKLAKIIIIRKNLTLVLEFGYTIGSK